jgi:hypothetical protein
MNKSKKKSFISDVAKWWNKAPEKIRTSKTLATAKKVIQDHCKSLPIQDRKYCIDYDGRI